MELPVFDTLELVPEAFRTGYAKREDGKFAPIIASEFTKERSKHAQLLDERKQEEKRRETAEQLAATEKTRADAAEAAAKTGKTKEELDAYAATVVKPVETERDTFKTKANDAQAKLDRNDLEKLVRKNAKDAGLMVDRLDDEDNMNVLLRNVTITTGADGKQSGVVNGADGKPTATAFLEHLKSFLPTKPWLYVHPGTTGGGMQHSDGITDTSPATAEKAVEQINKQNAARRNPLAPKVVAKA